MESTLLQVEGLRTYLQTPSGVVRAVDGVSLEIRRGETFALLGESGCGKSMTALSVMRLVPQPAGRITAGRVLLNGEDLLRLPEVAMRQVRGGRIGMIFQEPMTSLNPVLTVERQISESLRRHQGLRGRAAREKVLELLDAVGIPDPARRAGEYPHQLSGGMKQRVMIAIALAGEPELLIADEPTTALDVTIQAQVLDLLRELQEKTGMAILLITHDLGVVAGMADRVAVMYAGQVVEQADRDSFFRDARHPYSCKLFDSLPDAGKRDRPLAVMAGSVPSLTQEFRGCRFEPRCDHAFADCREREPGWHPVSGSQGVRCHLAGLPSGGDDGGRCGPAATPERRAAQPAAETGAVEPVSQGGAGGELLSVRDLKVHFPIHKGVLRRVVGHIKAVDGLSLDIPAGHTLALVGESGCGKTTAGKGILQLVPPTGGSVRFRGEELTALDGRRLRAHRGDLQIIFQDPYSSMNPRMLVGDIIEEGMLSMGIGGGRRQRRERVAELLEQVGLSPEAARRYPHEFSGGQRQRICIARALAVEPKLIVCDEPTSALDVSVQAQILNLLKRLQSELGISYLFITHNISVVSYLADEVAVMYLGRIVEQGRVDEVLGTPRHPYTRALLSAVPVADPERGREVIRLEGDMPSPAAPPEGCHFHPRCPQAMEVCAGRYPPQARHSATHMSRCFLYEGAVIR
jgi:peptide/nickel transport system ATP-binding protein